MSDQVKLVVADDLRRNRVTVFFRLLLAIPHFIWLAVWGIAVVVVVIVTWFAALLAGRAPEALHGFIARYLRYAVHVGAYVNLLADPYPRFDGSPGYPVDVEIAPAAPQSRWAVAFRIVLAIPAALIAAALSSGWGEMHGGVRVAVGVLGTVAFLGWFASLARAQMPRGMRDAGAWGLSYSAQTSAYLMLLTDRYPLSDPHTALADLPTDDHPVRLTVDDDLRRSRLTVFFRLLLALPHLVWLSLWGIVALVAVIVNWLATLIAGRSPEGVHRFLSAYLRYETHVIAYLTLTANPFPGFVGAAGSYPIDAVVAPPETQSRWTVAFRAILAFPAMVIGGAYGSLLWTTALLGWFASLALGRMPEGMRNAAATALRYTVQVNAYVWLLTPRYPYSGPTAAAPGAPAPTAAPAAAPPA